MIKVLLKQPGHSTLDANVLLVHHSLYLKEKKDAERIKYYLRGEILSNLKLDMIKVLLKQHSTLDANVLLVHHSLF
jgi:putative NIF3 family GTP cyclohydrolase 1 type 2